jgi:predicted CoA-binding protein
MEVEVNDPAEILRAATTIAIVGLSDKPDRPSHDVAKQLQERGFRIVPVNPMVEGEILGEKVYPSLSDIPFAVDLVDVFRKAEQTPEIARDAVAIGAPALWLQLDIVSEESRAIAKQGGLKYVENHCTAVESRKADIHK